MSAGTTTTESQLSWSRELTEHLDESSKDHFIDIHERSLILSQVEKFLRPPGAKILDIGCGPGHFLNAVHKRFPQTALFGSDLEEGAVEKCRVLNPFVSCSVMDLTRREGLRADSFDVITALNILEHIEDDRSALKNIHSMLRDDGVCLITVPAGPRLYDIYDEVYMHFRRYDLKDLIKKAEDAGFKVLKANYFASFIYPLFFLQKTFNRLSHRNRQLELKKSLVFRQNKTAKNSRIMRAICWAERQIFNRIRFPFGIRILLLVQKA